MLAKEAVSGEAASVLTASLNAVKERMEVYEALSDLAGSAASIIQGAVRGWAARYLSHVFLTLISHLIF